MKILGGKRCRTLLISLLAIFVAGMIYFGYFCPDQVCALSSGSPTPQYKTLALEAYLKGELVHEEFSNSDLDRDYDFDIEGEDVLVFLHVQKTGGTTFGRHLVKNIELSTPCQCIKGRKRCKCTNSQKKVWLFSRYSTGWVCGLHADWTELQDCVNDALDKVEHDRRRRRYLYISILRDPIMRYLSEWKHVQRGSTWLAAKLRCNGRAATLEEVPFCFEGIDWSGVSIDGFLDCPHNLAANRLTRMFSNLSLVNCYNQTGMTKAQRDAILLQSAKENLQNMAFFGLTEYQRATQYMFERTFKLKFREDFMQKNITHASATQLTKEQQAKVIEKNGLDIQLYQFAKDLFIQRLRHFQEQDAKLNVTLPPDLSSLTFDHLPNPGGGMLTSSDRTYKATNKNNSDTSNTIIDRYSSLGRPRRRHKYRTEKEIAMAVDEGMGGGETLPRRSSSLTHQGFIVPQRQPNNVYDNNNNNRGPSVIRDQSLPYRTRDEQSIPSIRHKKSHRLSYDQQLQVQDYVP